MHHIATKCHEKETLRITGRLLIMARTTSLQDMPNGKGRVRAPMATDAMANTLRCAFGADRSLPSEMDHLLAKLTSVA